MKRKLIFLAVVIVSMFAMLAITSSAAPYTFDFGEVEKIDFFENYAANNNGVDYITTVMTNPQATSKDSRVTLACTCEKGEHTYPTYYIMAINPNLKTLFQKNYENINKYNPCEATYTKDSIIAVEIPEGITDFWGDYSSGTFSFHTALKFVKIPSTLDDMHYLPFKGCTSLEWVDFGNNNKITYLGASAFNGCTSLKGICLPDSIKTMDNATFIGCVNLGPVHLPDSLTSFGTATNWNTFQGGLNGEGAKCTKLFFTNERFDNPDEVEKPDVYYMPKNFKSCGDLGFWGMSNINDVVVFPTTYTAVTQSRMFSDLGGTKDNPKTIVFLGNMTSFLGYANEAGSYTNFVFANENDVVGDFTYSFTYSGSHESIYMYSCASKQVGAAYQTSWTTNGFTHFVDIREATKVVDATCSSYAEYQNKCFCGADADITYGTEYDANNHNYENTEVVSIVYTKYDENGIKTVKCGYGCSVNGTKTASPIFKTVGYSIKNSGYGISAGYSIDKIALDEYEGLMGEITFGVIIANAETFGDSFMANGALLNSYGIQLEIDSAEYNRINSTVADFTSSEKDLKLVMALYVIDDGNVSYIQHNGTYDGTVEKDGVTLDVVTITKIADLTGTTLPFITPTPAPTGDEENV